MVTSREDFDRIGNEVMRQAEAQALVARLNYVGTKAAVEAIKEEFERARPGEPTQEK